MGQKEQGTRTGGRASLHLPAGPSRTHAGSPRAPPTTPSPPSDEKDADLARAFEVLRLAHDELATQNARLVLRNAELGRVNEDLTNLLSSARLPIVFLGPGLRIRRFTPAAEQVLGLTGLDVGRPITDLRHRLRLEALEEKIRCVIRDVAVVEHEVQGPDGRWFHLRIQPYRTSERSVDGAVLVLLDVDGLKRAAEELLRSNRDLENFASFVSHELREPLRNMGHFLELVGAEDLPAATQRDLQRVQENLARVTRLVAALLRFSQVGREGLERRPVALADVVDEARETAVTALREADARIVKAHDLPAVVGDPTLLADLFSNMFINAAQHRGSKRPHVRVSAQHRSGMVCVCVQDNGTGIDLENPDDVFGLFRRGGSPASQGSGIGLALCRKVVELHGGHIWVESRPGRGTSFNFTLPAHKPEGDAAVAAN